MNSNDSSKIASDTPDRDTKPTVDITEAPQATIWLRDELGRGPLSGIFWQGNRLVHVPTVAEDGYEPLTDQDDADDGPAQIRPVTPHYLVGQITYRYNCVRQQSYRTEPVINKKTGKPQQKAAMFAAHNAQVALAAMEAPNARKLKGVIHTPIHRKDGTLITEPGYDEATGLMYLPEHDLDIPAISDNPSEEEVSDAVELLFEMLDGFRFVSNSDRTNYIGALLTPLLRNLAPPSYKMVAIEAHQPSSGKTLLAKLMQIIHSGVFRSEMPEDDSEIRKQITSILTQTTGASVVIDNVTGILKSSALAGLLTSNTWTDRELGSKEYVSAPNDRLWMITGNNLAIAGDLPRRTIRVAIDPGCPNPENRTDFAIKDLEGWAGQRRSQLIHALLTLIQSWVKGGMTKADASSSDSYAKWTEVVRGVLQHCGVAGIFDGADTKFKAAGDEEDWAIFLQAVYDAFGDKPWTARELLEKVEISGDPQSIPLEALPGNIAEKAERASSGPRSQTRTLGRWLTNRIGRWGGRLCVREAGNMKGAKSTRLWYIQAQPKPQPQSTKPQRAQQKSNGATPNTAQEQPFIMDSPPIPANHNTQLQGTTDQHVNMTYRE